MLTLKGNKFDFKGHVIKRLYHGDFGYDFHNTREYMILATRSPHSLVTDIIYHSWYKNHIQSHPCYNLYIYQPSVRVISLTGNIALPNSIYSVNIYLNHQIYLNASYIEMAGQCDLLAPCANGGTCLMVDGQYSCDCIRGYSDRNCTTSKHFIIYTLSR